MTLAGVGRRSADVRVPWRAQAGGRDLDLRPLGLQIAGKRCLDAGASTGGFTQVLLEHGAARSSPSTSGTGSSRGRCRPMTRVIVVDRTNVRDLTLDIVGDRVELVVADLSFIPLGLVLPALVRSPSRTPIWW